MPVWSLLAAVALGLSFAAACAEEIQASIVRVVAKTYGTAGAN